MAYKNFNTHQTVVTEVTLSAEEKHMLVALWHLCKKNRERSWSYPEIAKQVSVSTGLIPTIQELQQYKLVLIENHLIADRKIGFTITPEGEGFVLSHDLTTTGV